MSKRSDMSLTLLTARGEEVRAEFMRELEQLLTANVLPFTPELAEKIEQLATRLLAAGIDLGIEYTHDRDTLPAHARIPSSPPPTRERAKPPPLPPNVKDPDKTPPHGIHGLKRRGKQN